MKLKANSHCTVGTWTWTEVRLTWLDMLHSLNSRCLQTNELWNECFCTHLLYSFTVPFTVATEYEYC